MGLSDEQIEQMRKELEARDKKKPEPKPEPNNQKENKQDPSSFQNGITVVSKWALKATLYVGAVITCSWIFGAAIDFYRDMTTPEIPTISYDGPIEEHYEESLKWCKNTILNVPGYGRERNTRERGEGNHGYEGGYELKVHFKDRSLNCNGLAGKAGMVNLIRRFGKDNRDALTLNEQVEYYRPGWERTSRKKILSRLDEYKPEIRCDIDLGSVPYQNESELWSRDIKKINTWIEEEQQRLDHCMQTEETTVPQDTFAFLHKLYLDYNNPKIEQNPFYVLFTSDPKIHQAHKNLMKKWLTAKAEKTAQNFKQWVTYREDTLKPKAERGRRSEAELDRAYAKEQADKAFRKKYGTDPDTRCGNYSCREYHEQGLGRITGWDDGERTIKKIASFSRYAQETQRKKEQAQVDALVNQYQAQQSIESFTNSCGTKEGKCNHLPVLTETIAEKIDWEAEQRKADQKDREIRAEYADKKKQSNERRKIKDSPDPDCGKPPYSCGVAK